MISELQKKTEEILESLSEELDVEIIELKVNHKNKDVIIDVVADKPQGGITLDECAHLNKHLVLRLEKGGYYTDNVSFTVSSPGIDRPLKTTKDFKRVLGKDVRFHLSDKVEEKLEHVGRIHAVDEKNVFVHTKNNDVTIPLDIINKAIQVIENK